MGIVQKDALRTTIISYLGMALGYVNKVFLFVLLLSLKQIGLVTIVFSVGAMFAQFANLGTVNTTWKFFPFLKNETNKHYGFLTLNILIVLSGILFFSVAALLFGDLVQQYFGEKSELFVDYYLWVVPVGVGIVLFKLLESYLKALYKNVFPVFANEVVYRLCVTALLCLHGMKVLSFEHLFMALCLTQFIPALLLIVYLMRIGEWQFSIKSITIPRKFRKVILSYSLFTYANSLGAILVISLDSIMIAGMLGLEDNGVYSITRYLIAMLVVPYIAIMRVSAPLVSEHWKQRDMVKMRELYQKVSSVNLVIGLFLFMGVWVSRVELFQFLPPEFEAGIYVFLFLMIGRVLDMYFGVNGIILVTSKKYKYDMIFTISLIVLVVVLNLLFIPIWGIVGAAISTSLAYLFYNVVRMAFVWYHYAIHPFMTRHLTVLALFLAGLGFFHFVPLETGNIWLNMIVKSVLVCLFFPLVIYLFKMEPEIVDYANKVLGTAKKKLSGK